MTIIRREGCISWTLLFVWWGEYLMFIHRKKCSVSMKGRAQSRVGWNFGFTTPKVTQIWTKVMPSIWSVTGVLPWIWHLLWWGRLCIIQWGSGFRSRFYTNYKNSCCYWHTVVCCQKDIKYIWIITTQALNFSLLWTFLKHMCVELYVVTGS